MEELMFCSEGYDIMIMTDIVFVLVTERPVKKVKEVFSGITFAYKCLCLFLG